MYESAKIGIIGGTGVYQLPGVEQLSRQVIPTPYGNATVNTGILSGKKIAFLTRHGENHTTSPGQINYRANIWALKLLGVRQIIATACSGSLNPVYPAGSFVMLEQFFELTKNRIASFYENDGQQMKKIAHVDVTHPYCRHLSSTVVMAGHILGIPIKEGAVYSCMEGPRFETDAEIKMLRVLGADLVAQTQYPEVVLAREAQICYAAIGIVSNMAAGMTSEHVSAKELKTNMDAVFETIQSILAKSIDLMDTDRTCWCQHALDQSEL